jgi:DNA polymerase-1
MRKTPKRGIRGSPATIGAVKPLLVIDGDSLGHRSYHAMPAVEGAGGRPVGLLVGFANVLLASVRTTEPRAVIVCMDTRGRSYRHDILPAYQGRRDPFADDLREQLDRIPELAEAFGYAAVKLAPWEADDLLATAVTLEEARGGGALVLSSDRDTYQLVSDVTATLHPRPRGVLERVDRAGVRERYGIEPEQVTSLIALRGDPSDNIPGARGIGAKGAAELLVRYGDLEGVIAHAAELTPRQRLAVEGSADELRGYREVATMRRDLPIAIPDDAELDAASAAAWCSEAGMRRLAERLEP